MSNHLKGQTGHEIGEIVHNLLYKDLRSKIIRIINYYSIIPFLHSTNRK